jgi:quercetin dioxygenase-like cupin family protein
MPFVHRNHAVIRISGEGADAYFSKRHGKPTVPAQPNPPSNPAPTRSSRDTGFNHRKDQAMNTITRWTAALAVPATLLFAAPAVAGTCPAGQAVANPLANAQTMPAGVTDDLVGSVDLEKELTFADHDLRLRRLVVQPGGVVPLHSHTGRPALITVVTGEITEYSSSCAVGIDHHAGDVASESGGVSHWWKNNGTVAAVLLSADVKGRD